MAVVVSVQALVSVGLSECCDCVPESVVVKLLEAVLKSVPSLQQHCAMSRCLFSLQQAAWLSRWWVE